MRAKDRTMHNINNGTVTEKDEAVERESALWQRRVEMNILILAQKAELMTYDALATSADITPPHRIHKLTLFLETLIAQDIAHNAPIRASVVISKIRGLPAPGFFACLQEHGIAVIKGDEKALHERLLKAVNPAFQS